LIFVDDTVAVGSSSITAVKLRGVSDHNNAKQDAPVAVAVAVPADDCKTTYDNCMKYIIRSPLDVNHCRFSYFDCLGLELPYAYRTYDTLS